MSGPIRRNAAVLFILYPKGERNHHLGVKYGEFHLQGSQVSDISFTEGL